MSKSVYERGRDRVASIRKKMYHDGLTSEQIIQALRADKGEIGVFLQETSSIETLDEFEQDNFRFMKGQYDALVEVLTTLDQQHDPTTR